MDRTTPSATRPAPRLAPGVHVVHRDDEHLQVGLDPPARVIVRRDHTAVTTLESLRGRPGPTAVEPSPALLRSLDTAGLLAHPQAPRTGSVAVVDRGLGLHALRRLLEGGGVEAAADPASADLVVVGAPAPVPRALLDDWVRDGTTHLVLAGTGHPGSLRLGPLVEPGSTACLRCVDAAESTHDPRRTLVVEQLAVRPAAPLDPALVAVGAAWAAREVAAYVAGRRPATWSATLDLDPPVPRHRVWERHPHCGCAWDDLPY
jgi:hypothetical protein